MIKKCLIYTLLMIASIDASLGQCQLDSLQVTVSDCSFGKVVFWLDFDNSQTTSDRFSVKGNGMVYGDFAYRDLPVKIGPISPDPSTKYEFVVQDLRTDSCMTRIDYGFIQCDHDSCFLSDLSVWVTDSCLQGTTYKALVDFESQGFTHFKVYMNGDFLGLGEVKELPIHLALTSQQPFPDTIKIIADGHEACFSSVSIQPPVLCQRECVIADPYAHVVTCDDSIFYVKLGFTYGGEEANSFTVKVNGNHYGSFPFNEWPLLLGPFEKALAEKLELVIADSLNPDCVRSTGLKSWPCKGGCPMGALSAQVTHCDRGIFEVLLNLEYTGDLADSFLVKGNGQVYGYYAYSDLPVVVGGLQADGETKYEFILLDQKDQECRRVAVLEPVDCYCLWSELEVKSGLCSSDSTYIVEVNFRSGNVEAFDLYTRGRLLGHYQVEELPVKISDFPASGHHLDEIWICASGTNCCRSFKLEAPGCGQKVCSIEGLQVVPVNCQNGQYDLKIDFISEGNYSDKFIIKYDHDIIGEYRYRDLPVSIGPFSSEDSLVHLIEVCDINAPECHASLEILTPLCNCNPQKIEIEVGECTSDTTYQVVLSSDLKGAFDLYVNDHFCGTFSADQLPLTFNDFPASGQPFDYLKICALDSNYCCIEKKIESPFCARVNCHLGEMQFEITECNVNHEFYVKLNIAQEGSPMGTFLVQYQNSLLEFSYDALPVKLGPFDGGIEFHRFIVYDSELPECRKEINLGRVICEEQCDLAMRHVSLLGCAVEENLVLHLDSLEGSFNAFDIYYADHYLGFYKKEQLPLRLAVPNHSADDSVLVRICVSDNKTCCFPIRLAVPDCQVYECQIINAYVDTIGCRNDSFWVKINVESAPGDTSTYQLIRDGERPVSEFTPGALPLWLGPYVSDEDVNFHWVIRSKNQPDCREEVNFSGITCPGSRVTKGEQLLMLESSGFINFIKVPDLVRERSLFELVDLNGRILFKLEFSTSTTRSLIQIPFLPSGMYLVRIISRDQINHISKIIIP